MKIITINLPEKYLEAIQTLQDIKLYGSRSEALRVALQNFLDKELRLDQELTDTKTFKRIMINTSNKMRQNN